MAEATLRAYLKDIDDLIEREQLDEAIAHCRHILQVYPKHLDTYRLLGKAYLEAKRFGDAADIFQRVLSAVPDDFVAHVGMSIVREDEGNTDAAIWHMERAFETTPANPAIQQELRRLIGRRDGIEPHKVRLTRGALARMYAHGELYPQAVAELRAALQEDAERADLQVVLAEMYWRTGQRAESVEVANKIIEKLPYCREANRILAAAYQSSGRTEEAATHHRRLATLDPYAAFIETPMSDPQAVDPGSVRLDRLEWAPGQAMPLGQPEWASSLSADLRGETPAQPVSGPVPSWLEEAPPAAPAETAPPPPTPPPTPQPAAPPPTPPAGTDIPSWMREAGWSESTGAAVEGPVGFTEEEISSLEGGAPPLSETGNLAPGEIPEWLQAVAPKQPVADESLPESWGEKLATPSDGGGQAPPWLGEAEAALEPEPEAPWEPPVAEEQPATFEPEPGLPEGWGAPPAEAAGLPSEADLENQPLPSWLEEPSPGATDTIITWLGDRAARDTGDLAIPSWLDESARVGETPAPVEEPPVLSFPEEVAEEAPPSEPEPATTALPGWLAGVADAAAQQEPMPEEDLARLRERGEAAPIPEGEPWAGAGGESEEETPLAEREAPDWLRGIVEPGAEPESPAEPEPGPSWLAGSQIPKPRGLAPAPEPDWMRGLGEPGAESAEMPQQEVREAPGWLKSIQDSREPRPKAEEEAPVWMQEPAPAAGAGIGEPEEEWQAGVGEEIPAAEMAKEPPSEEGAALAEAELPDWLSSIVPPEEEAAPSAEMPSEEELGGALGWLEEPGAAEATVPQAEPVAAAVEPEPVAAAEVSGEDDVMEWLESLAAQQATGEGVGVAETEIVGEEEPLVEERVLPEEPAEGLEWLERLAATRGVEPGEEAPAAEAAAPEAAPDWLQPYAAEPAAAAEPSGAEPADALDWLRAEEQAAPAELPSDLFEEEPAEAAAYDEDSHIPTWLLDASKAPPAVEAPAMPPSIDEMAAPPYEEPAEALAEDTAIPDWLRASMAAPTRPAEGPGQPAAPAAEPGWIEPPTEAAPPIAAEIEAAVPDWLRIPSEPPPTAPAMAAGAEAEPESVWELVPAPRAPEPEVAPPAPTPAPRLPEVVAEPVFEAVPPQLPVEAPAAPPAPLPEAPEPILAPAVFPPAVTEPPPPPEVPPAPPLPPAPAPAVPPEPLPVFEPVFEPVPARAAPSPEPPPPPAAAPPVAPEPPPLPVAAPAAPPPAYPAAQPPVPPAPWEPTPAFAPAPAPQPPPAPYAPPAPPTYPPPAPSYPAPAYPQPQPAYPMPAAPQPTYPAPGGPPPVYPAPQPPYPAPGAPQPPYPAPGAPQPGYPAPAAPQPMYPPPAAPQYPYPAPAAPQPSYPAPQPYWPPYPPAPPYAPQPAPEAPYPPATYAPPPSAPVPVPAPAPAQPPKGRAAGPAPEELLEQARSAMKSGDIQGALSLYATLIKKKKLLSAVIDDLKSAVEHGAMPPAVWQTLGDAYMKSDRLPEAIETYRHGLESV